MTITMVQFAITGELKHLDGFMELLTGTLTLAGLLVSYEAYKDKLEDGELVLFINAVCKTPPLASMGLDDIQWRVDYERGRGS